MTTLSAPISPAFHPAMLAGQHSSLENSMGRAFRATLLLTASEERATAAVLEGLRLAECHELCPEVLFRGALQAALRTSGGFFEPRIGEMLQASHSLPPELRRVLELSSSLRHSYVLRLLCGLPSSICAEMLGIDRATVEAHAHKAAAVLPR